MIPDLEKRFDTSKYPEKHPSGIQKGVNAGAIGGIFKDELKPILEFVGLAAKRYCIRTEEKCEKRNKGVPKRVVSEKIGIEHFEKCLRENAIYHSHFVKIGSHLHRVTTDLVKKDALSGFDDKRIIIPDDPTHSTLALFHEDAPESVKEHCDKSGPAKIVNTPFTIG